MVGTKWSGYNRILFLHTYTRTYTQRSKVFLCKRKVDNSLIVIKQITVDELQKEDRKAAMNEIDILERLKHPNIIAYFDSFVDDKSLMIVMEYAPGGTLFDFIQDRNGTLLGEEVHTLREFVWIVEMNKGCELTLIYWINPPNLKMCFRGSEN